jgi:nucleoside-diphosphate-sugar epimerase
MMSSHTHVVLGASGAAGSAIARALAQEGLASLTVSRHGDTDRHADVETLNGARAAVEGAAVVYMAAQPPYTEWPERFPAMLANVIEATAAVGAKLVMVDNLYAYGPVDGSLHEGLPELAGDAKGRTRHRMTDMLLAAHREGRLRVTIGRASDYFGPNGDNSGITALAIAPPSMGKKARWVGSLDMPHSAAYLPDLARAFVTLATDDRADGRIWHLPHAPAVTGREFIELVNLALPQPVDVGVVSKTMLRLAAPFHPISRETLPLVHQWDRPFVVDDSAFRAKFGPFVDTSLEVTA